jgi:ribonuclease HI
MEIVDRENNFYIIDIICQHFSGKISYFPGERHLKFLSEDSFTEVLQAHEYQLRKILHNKRSDSFYIGFKLKFVIRDNKEVIAFNDLSKIIVYDSRGDHPLIKAIDYYRNDFITLYTDGSYSEKKQKCAYVALIKNRSGLLDIRYGIKQVQNSSLIELLAVSEGLKVLADEEKLRIVTDSRYVIKGLTEWIYNWRLNDWYTAQGEKVKHMEYWKQYLELTKGKYIEFDWVKAHSFHLENSLCDKYAKELLAKI